MIFRDFYELPIILTEILGWSIYMSFLALALHVLACAIFRFILVLSQDLISDSDNNILRKTRIGIFAITIGIAVFLFSIDYKPESVKRLQGDFGKIPTNWLLKIRTLIFALSFLAQAGSRMIIYCKYWRKSGLPASNEVFSSWTLMLLAGTIMFIALKKTTFGYSSNYLMIFVVFVLVPLQTIFINKPMRTKMLKLIWFPTIKLPNQMTLVRVRPIRMYEVST